MAEDEVKNSNENPLKERFRDLLISKHTPPTLGMGLVMQAVVLATQEAETGS